MREYAKIYPQFWVGETGRRIKAAGPEATVVAIYLLSSPHSNMLGLYYLPKVLISHETGLSAQGASKGLQRCFEGGFCSYDEQSEMVFVYEMAKFQIEEQLKENDNRVKGINKEYQNLPKSPFLSQFYHKYKDRFYLQKERGTEGACKPLRSHEQEQEQEQEKDIVEKPRRQIPFKQIIDYLNKQANTSFKHTTKTTRSHIKARYNEGFDRVEFFQRVIDTMVSEWAGDQKMVQYLRPQTLFGTKFEAYLQKSETQGGGNEPPSKFKPSEYVQKRMEQK